MQPTDFSVQLSEKGFCPVNKWVEGGWPKKPWSTQWQWLAHSGGLSPCRSSCCRWRTQLSLGQSAMVPVPSKSDSLFADKMFHLILCKKLISHYNPCRYSLICSVNSYCSPLTCQVLILVLGLQQRTKPRACPPGACFWVNCYIPHSKPWRHVVLLLHVSFSV